MTFTNYWNQMSGDSQASPWNQELWAAGAPAQQPGNNPVAPDHQKEDTRYGFETTDPGAGLGGYWSGGRPGAGSWMENLQSAVPNGATGTENRADGTMMTHQMYSRSEATDDSTMPGAANPYMINNVQMSATEPLSNWYLKEQAQEQATSGWGGSKVTRRQL